MTPTTHLYITDKTGGKLFRVTCSTAYKQAEINNLQHHLNNARKYPREYNFMDIETARIVEESK